MAANLDVVEAKKKLKNYFEVIDPRMGKIYIPPMGGNTERADKPFKLFSEIERRFSETDLRSLLLLGNSGMGKTCLGLHYCRIAWQSINLDESIEDNPIPLYIYLPRYKYAFRPENGVFKKDLLNIVLEKQIGLSKNERIAIKKQPLLLILDGFDEIDIGHNLYAAQRWDSHDLNIRILTTCRPDAVSKKDRQMLFEVASLNGHSYFETIYLQSFTDEQIEEYLSEYLKRKVSNDINGKEEQIEEDSKKEKTYFLSVSDYRIWFEKLPELQALIRTPFLLMVIAKVLPNILSQLPEVDDILQRKFTQNELFYCFLDDWFLAQTEKVKKDAPTLHFCKKDLYLYMWVYAQNLASSRLRDNGQLDDSAITEEESLNLALIEPVHNLELLKIYQKEHRKLFEEHKEYIRLIRSGCLLHTIDEEFKFLHKSITEYLASKELMDGVLAESNHYLNSLLNPTGKDDGRGLNRVLLIATEPEILLRLSEAAQCNNAFEKLLWDIILKSKDTYGLWIAAANAITILNYAGIDFSAQDLSNVQIPGADLRSGNFVNVNFSGANLQGVNFSQAYLRQSNFSGANLDGVQFGEKAYYELKSLPTSLAYYRSDLNDMKLQWLVGCEDGYVYSYNDEGKYIAKFRHRAWFDSNTKITAIAVHEPDHLLVTGGSDGRLFSWNLRNKAYLRKFERHNNGITCCAVTPDGLTLFSGSWDGTLRQWSIIDGRLVRVLKGHKKEVTCCTIAPNGLLLFSGSGDCTLRQWSIADGICMRILAGHEKDVRCCTVTPDGSTLFSGSWDGMVHQWSITDGTCVRILAGHEKDVRCCTITPDGTTLFSGSWDGTLRQWSIIDSTCVRVLEGHKGYVTSCTVTPDGSMLFSGGGDSILRQWSVINSKLVSELGKHKRKTIACMIIPNSPMLISKGENNILYQWSIVDGKLIREFQWHKVEMSCCAISSDGLLLVSGNKEGILYQWSIIDGKCIRVLVGHTKRSTCCAIAPDGLMLISGSEDGTLRQWSIMDGECIRVLEGHEKGITCCVIAPNGLVLISGSEDGTLRQWSIVDGKCIRVLEGHKRGITCCAISLDGSMLISGSRDSTLHQWSIVDGKCIRVLKGHKRGITCCAITLDNLVLVSGSKDGMLSLWCLDTGLCLITVPVDFVVLTILCWHGLLVLSDTAGQLFAWTTKNLLSPDLELKWNWIKRSITMLNLENINITQSLFLSPQNEILCRQRGSIGEPNKSKKSTYQSWCMLFKPILGTAHIIQESLIALNNSERFLIDNHNWVFSIVYDNQKSHGLLILEGVKDNRYFIIRADLYTEDYRYAQISLKSLDDLVQFKESVENYVANLFKISKEKGEALLRNIKDDQRKIIRYSRRGNTNPCANPDFNTHETHNCLSWCRKQANLIECNIKEKWYNFIFTLPNDIIQRQDVVHEPQESMSRTCFS